MPDVVGVRFKRAGKVYYFDPAGTELKVCDHVVVQTARGMELGQVTISPKQVLASEITAELKAIVRRANTEDVSRAQDYTAKEENALNECAKIITRLNMPMKLVSAEYNLDGSRLTFYFIADERVDFRELVRELTGFFKTRIELRQIGPRDQAKMIGGLGRCGRPLCCASYLTEFNPVSIKMAKEQDLPLDPMKISGVCGRLQCCLAYESSTYHDIKAGMPKKGQRVHTPSGDGWVTGVYPLKETLMVEIEGQANAEFPVSQVKLIDEPTRIQNQGNAPVAIEENAGADKSATSAISVVIEPVDKVENSTQSEVNNPEQLPSTFESLETLSPSNQTVLKDTTPQVEREIPKTENNSGT
jgi:cell fate regulator YaaT (PSP1 superfamily)